MRNYAAMTEAERESYRAKMRGYMRRRRAAAAARRAALAAGQPPYMRTAHGKHWLRTGRCPRCGLAVGARLCGICAHELGERA